MKIELKAQRENLVSIQTYQAIAEVAEAVFGDPKKKRRRPDEDVPKTKEQALEMFAALMGNPNG